MLFLHQTWFFTGLYRLWAVIPMQRVYAALCRKWNPAGEGEDSKVGVSQQAIYDLIKGLLQVKVTHHNMDGP